VVLGDVGGIELGEDSNLLNDVFHLILCIFDINDLDRDGLACSFVDTAEDWISTRSDLHV
jgi:hypothetical protein